MSPASLLVPVNTVVNFTCQAYCTSVCDIDWIIGNITANPYQKNKLKKEGFTFSDGPDKVNNTYTDRLTVNASLSLNGTELCCNVILDGANTYNAKSSPAILLTATGKLMTSK